MHTRTQPEPHGFGDPANPALGFVSLPVRLPPGADLRRALEQALAAHGAEAGFVLGGHAAYGCTMRTTAEVLVALLPRWQFSREPDARTGYDELVARPRSG